MDSYHQLRRTTPHSHVRDAKNKRTHDHGSQPTANIIDRHATSPPQPHGALSQRALPFAPSTQASLRLVGSSHVASATSHHSRGFQPTEYDLLEILVASATA